MSWATTEPPERLQEFVVALDGSDLDFVSVSAVLENTDLIRAPGWTVIDCGDGPRREEWKFLEILRFRRSWVG
jgi:hypothetical protein